MYPWPENITCLEISKQNIKHFKKRHPDIVILEGDALNMPFTDDAFDIVFSNAVIEHVGGDVNQIKYADEVRRVSSKHFITTPNKMFPFEPHYRLPLFQFIPKPIQRWLSNYFTLGNYPKGCWENINLLTPWEMQDIFSDSYLTCQRVTFMAETLIAIKE
jgi:2-polyprenyl-3-methyl-5-hydroxy-6-metoxy-1,4-benzoquinol methylase